MTAKVQSNWSIEAKTLYCMCFRLKTLWHHGNRANFLTFWKSKMLQFNLVIAKVTHKHQRIGRQAHAHFAHNASLIFRSFLRVSKVEKVNICYSMHCTIWQTQSSLNLLRFSNAHFEAYGIFQQINATRVDKNWLVRNGAIFGRLCVITPLYFARCSGN